ncbi:MAG: VOC family protein [Acidobacteria bacterium]|nr:VOC family protein [Acidobacteriota bacterium]
MAETPGIGSIGWVDLTVPDAPRLRDFYQAVVGWTSEGCPVGGYEDYVMSRPDTAAPVAGICHKQGVNAELPAVWMVYFTVGDLDESIRRCQAGGGRLVAGPRGFGPTARYCVIEDPAGAHCALFEQKAS